MNGEKRSDNQNVLSFQKVGEITGEFARVTWKLETKSEVIQVRDCFCPENTVVQMPQSQNAACANGVCSLTWKPKKPAA